MSLALPETVAPTLDSLMRVRHAAARPRPSVRTGSPTSTCSASSPGTPATAVRCTSAPSTGEPLGPSTSALKPSSPLKKETVVSKRMRWETTRVLLSSRETCLSCVV